MAGSARARLIRAGVLALCVSLATACAQPRVAGEMATAAPALVGVTWRLVEFRSAVGTVRPERPDQYTLTLQEDGRATLRLDCNRGSGTWTATPEGPDRGSLGMGRIAMTRALCPPPSMDTQIARDPPASAAAEP
ncbi:MAG: META domain-containing protein [Gemmatimonadetes bacterium]|nr:META domain-containing protein [Gemmatimonadota bacterium]